VSRIAQQEAETGKKKLAKQEAGTDDDKESDEEASPSLSRIFVKEKAFIIHELEPAPCVYIPRPLY
jgi:hypothetical protein